MSVQTTGRDLERQQGALLLFFNFILAFWHTLVYRIDVQYELNMQVEKFLKNIKRAGQNRRAGGKISWKINNRAGGK